MMIFRAYKVELAVNNAQETKLRQHLGCARWAYNFALAKKKEAFDNKTKIPGAMELHKELNELKKTDIPWMYHSSKSSPQNAIRDCDTAFKNFFRRCKQKTPGKRGFPKFKSRRNEKQSFRLDGAIRILDGLIQLPKLEKLRIVETNYIPKDCKILSATVSHKCGKWFVSVQAMVPEVVALTPINDVIGVDLGIKMLATCSDGTTYENPKALLKNKKSLKIRQQSLSRKVRGSVNYKKAKLRVAKLHNTISNIRKDAIHKATSKIISENQTIVLEGLSVAGMMKNHRLAGSIGDASFFEFRRQIEYKAKWCGRTVIIADRFFPSSKTDHKTGVVNDTLKLSDRTIYHEDGSATDRDLNAAINLRNYYLNLKNTESSSGIQACGDGSSGSGESRNHSPSMKQEFNIKQKVEIL